MTGEDIVRILQRSSAKERAAFGAVYQELERARRLHREFPTYHHALGVIREEYKEVEKEIFKRDAESWAVAHELVQLAAMSIRALTDLDLVECPE